MPEMAYVNFYGQNVIRSLLLQIFLYIKNCNYLFYRFFLLRNPQKKQYHEKKINRLIKLNRGGKKFSWWFFRD